MNKPDRRQSILDATITLLSRKGLAAVTHRAVDEEAALPKGSTSYYFSKKAALLEAAATRLVDRLNLDCEETRLHFSELVADGKTDEAIDYVADDLLKFADEERDLLLARVELTLASSRSPELRDMGTDLTASAQQAIEFFVRLLSQTKDPAHARTCLGLLDGLMLIYVTGQGPKPTRDQLKQIFQTVTA